MSVSEAYYSAFAKFDGNGLCTIEFLIEGVHCAACIQKIENTVKSNHEVQEVRLNFSTKRLRVIWQGAPDKADSIAQDIAKLGYKVLVYNAQAVNTEYESENRFLLLCTGVAGFAAGNIMLLSFALWTADASAMGIATRDFLHWVSALIALPAVSFSGRPFFRSAYKVLKSGKTNMDVPISLALVLATSMSLYQLINHAQDAYFDSAVMLMFFLLVGRYLDFRARARARSAASDLLALMAGTATVIENGKMRVIAISDLEEAMIVQVGIGERIPADGIIIDGNSEIDMSLITGESLPIAVMAEEKVYSGSLNVSSSLKIKIGKKAEDSFLADVIRLMEKAEQSQSAYVRLADRIARLYTPVVHTLAAASFIGWFCFLNASWNEALLIAVTVLIITCPCALALAVPVVQVLAVGQLMKKGVMVKSGDALERLAQIDTIFLDKTGTLSLGKPVLNNKDQISVEDLRLAASMAVHSKHPLSQALVKEYDGNLYDMSVTEISGCGLQAVYSDKELRLGSGAWCNCSKQENIDDNLELWLKKDNGEHTRFVFSDHLRDDAKDVIQKFMSMNKQIYLLSGDRDSVVKRVAKNLSIKNWYARMKPEDKFQMLENCRAENKKILMAGDGLNDAPVLAGADISISPSTAIDVAQNAADIVFTGEKFASVLTAYDIACFSQKLIKQNLALSICYNLIAVPLAITGHVNPLVAAIAMSSSSLLVVMNSFRLVRVK